MAEKFRQPTDWSFLEGLRQPQEHRVSWSGGESHGEPDIRCCFGDPEGLLETAVDSLRRFMVEHVTVTFAVTLRMIGADWRPESYELEADGMSCQVSAVDLEGLRRGIYELLDAWCGSPTPFLELKRRRHVPWLRNRISRCYFSPINRPPANRDELLDDENYYPEAYLDRLAASGINGLWISTTLQNVCETRFSVGDVSAIRRRVRKLSRTVARCRRYGIRIFLQLNDPVALPGDDPLFMAYPELRGVKQFGRHCFCPSSALGEAYLEESCRSLFEAVPDLGGLLNITLGEGETTCASVDHTRCPRCSQGSWQEVLHRTWRAMRRGMDSVAPDSELICWLYLPEPKVLEDRIYGLLDGVPSGVTVQLNCESGAVVEQCGKRYRVGDYWLSVSEPSENFRRFAQVAAEHDVSLSAKIQVGCSHEVATVPFVPVPGLLYRKYRELKRLNVTSVMQCWFFGNYPGIMNQAAGKLAFEDFQDSEESFLTRLARSEWGAHAEEVAGIWKSLGEAYENYPASNMFQYYGPVADGISWPLWFQPVHRGLTSTWLLEPEVNGDTVAEALMEMPMEDAIVQMRKLSRGWQTATKQLSVLREAFKDDPERLLDIGLVEALDCQFESAFNILRFYELRGQMEEIVERETVTTRTMLSLAERDPRLGFHSEAEGYKYYPEKLRWRLKQLEDGQGTVRYDVGSGWVQVENFRWKAEQGGSPDRLDIVVDLQGYLEVMDEFFLALDDCGVSFPALLHVDCAGKIYRQTSALHSVITRNAEGWQVKIAVDLKAYSPHRPLRINLVRLTEFYRRRFAWPPAEKLRPARLNLVFYQPDAMGVLGKLS